MTQVSLMHGNERRGFTLMEIILVVVIIMTLMAVVGPRIVSQGAKQKENITRIQIQSLKANLTNFYTQANRYPTTQEGLQALVTKPSGMDESEWPGQLIDSVPKDGFKHELKYVCPSEHGMDYDIISAGKDGKFGTSDDIANYDDQKKTTDQNL